MCIIVYLPTYPLRAKGTDVAVVPSRNRVLGAGSLSPINPLANPNDEPVALRCATSSKKVDFAFDEG